MAAIFGCEESVPPDVVLWVTPQIASSPHPVVDHKVRTVKTLSLTFATRFESYLQYCTIYSCGRHPECGKRTLLDVAEGAIQVIWEYAAGWKIRVNHTKTEVILFGLKRELQPPIAINRKRIKLQNTVTYLGVKFDRQTGARLNGISNNKQVLHSPRMSNVPHSPNFASEYIKVYYSPRLSTKWSYYRCWYVGYHWYATTTVVYQDCLYHEKIQDVVTIVGWRRTKW